MDTPITRAEHEEFCKRMEEEHNRQNTRLSLLEKGLDEVRSLTATIERLAVSMENMAKEQERQGERLETLEGRDGERWRNVMGFAITTVVGAVLGFVLSKIGI